MTVYTFEPIATDGAGLSAESALLRNVFPKATHFTDKGLSWQYADNPVGAARGFNAWAGQDLAAHYATIPLRASVQGVSQMGLLSLNTATSPLHQGKKLFSRLAQMTYDDAAAAGYAFVVGVANANSTPGFVGRLGFQLVTPLRAMIGIGPLPSRRSPQARDFETQWDPASLNWRLSRPGFDYTVLRHRARVIALSSETRLGATYVLGELPDSSHVASENSQKRLPLTKIWIGVDPALNWRRRAYVDIPLRFRPSPLNFIFKDLTGSGRTLDKERVVFEAIDFDVI